MHPELEDRTRWRWLKNDEKLTTCILHHRKKSNYLVITEKGHLRLKTNLQLLNWKILLPPKLNSNFWIRKSYSRLEQNPSAFTTQPTSDATILSFRTSDMKAERPKRTNWTVHRQRLINVQFIKTWTIMDADEESAIALLIPMCIHSLKTSLVKVSLKSIKRIRTVLTVSNL